MSSRPQTPVEAYGSRPTSAVAGQRPGTGSRPNSYTAPGNTGATDFAESHNQGAPAETSPLSQSGHYALQETTSAGEGSSGPRPVSQMSQSQTLLPSRGGTLKKKASLRKGGSLKRSSSRRSSRAGSVRSLRLGEKEKYSEEELYSAFYTPVPTNATPTDVLAERFQAWRKVLKDLITYFREIQKSYDTRSKSLVSASNVMSNTLIPSAFMSSGGLGDATHILRDFHKNALSESNKAKDLENEVILQLTGLRSDLQQKIKEIKSLSGDFKNNVDRETEGTRKAVRHLQEALGLVDSDPAAVSGRGDPFIVRMAVDRQLERQIEEENYLHRAYLNLESSGRELEAIVVGEIQKAYNAYANIIKREADETFETVEKLREGPIAMPKDREWENFVLNANQMVDPRLPLRQVEQILYPGKDHPAAIEVRSGMLERKSKYLKNYTPGWYVLSPTHLHEFKSADRIAAQTPIMSLYLPEQKLGSHSEPGSNSHKFMLKGRQTGGMHRGHSWIFRAETYDTMIAWFNDIKELTEKRGEERNAFVRRSHARSMSGNSFAASIGGSSDGGMEEDEADAVPYSDERLIRSPMNDITAGGVTGAGLTAPGSDGAQEWQNTSQIRQRPSPGGRFPSDLNVDRGLLAPLSLSSGESSPQNFHTNKAIQQQADHDALAAASSLPGSGVPFEIPQPSTLPQDLQRYDHSYPNEPVQSVTTPGEQTQYGQEWAPNAATSAPTEAGGIAVASHYQHHEQTFAEPQELDAHSPAIMTSSVMDPEAAPTVTDARTTETPSSARGATEVTDAASESTGLTSLATGMVTDEGEFGTSLSSGKTRPSMSQPTKSASTISDLHIPGEYPRQNSRS